MTFEDLPRDWPSRPLTDPRLIADVLDLLVTDADRRAGALLLTVCDEAGAILCPVMVHEVDDFATAAERSHVLGHLIEAMGQWPGSATLLAAIARAAGLSVTEQDHAWAESIRLACTSRLRLLGVHVITLAGSRPIPARVSTS